MWGDAQLVTCRPDRHARALFDIQDPALPRLQCSIVISPTLTYARVSVLSEESSELLTRKGSRNVLHKGSSVVMRRGDKLFLLGGSGGGRPSYPIRVSFGRSPASCATCSSDGAQTAVAASGGGGRGKRDRAAADQPTSGAASKRVKETTVGGTGLTAGGANAVYIGDAGTALRCSCQRPDQAMREGTSLGAETEMVAAGTAQAHSRAADSTRTHDDAFSSSGDSSGGQASTVVAAASTDRNDGGMSGASSSQGAEDEGREVHDVGARGTALGKRRRDVADELAAARRSRARRAQHGATTARPTQVAVRGRTLSSDISQSHTSILGKRDAEERGDGRAADSDAKRMRSGGRKIR